MGFHNMVKVKGLSGKQVSLDPLNILFMVEMDNDGKPATNVHFTNGQFVTTCLDIEELSAVLALGNKNYFAHLEGESEAEILEKQRKRAEQKRQMMLQLEDTLKLSDLTSGAYKRVSHRITTDPDGVKSIYIVLEPVDPTAVAAPVPGVEELVP